MIIPSNYKMTDPNDFSQSPWYSKTVDGIPVPARTKPKPKTGFSEFYTKGAKVPVQSKNFRKGACENCGSLSHTAKSCCERPRKISAKFSGDIVEYDEVVEQKNLDYEAKHDRWIGYDPKMYIEVIEEYKQVDDVKKKRKVEEIRENLYKDKDVDLSDEERNEAYAYSEMINNVDPRTKTVTYNNRTREDTACYLTNLDPEFNNYDGKSRSYKDVSGGSEDPEQLYRDSWVKVSGDMEKMVKQDSFIQKLNEKGNDLQSLTNPSQAELLYKHYQEHNKNKITTIKKRLIDKYGDQDKFEITEEGEASKKN
jgi:pre-mRNA-processing factor SLU7